MGVQPESAVKAFVDRLLGEEAATDAAAAIEAADKALEAGDLQGAAEVYAAVLQEDAQNVAALAGLARCYLKSGDVERAEQTIGLVPPDKRDTAAVASVRAALDLAKMAAKAGDTCQARSQGEGRAGQPPGAHRSTPWRWRPAARSPKRVDQLLESFRRDRKWNEEAARKQLVQFFDAWGPKDPATLDGRRRLSSILFS